MCMCAGVRGDINQWLNKLTVLVIVNVVCCFPKGALQLDYTIVHSIVQMDNRQTDEADHRN